MTAILRNVPKTFTFEDQRVEINEIALDLYNLESGTLELTSFSVTTGAAVSGGGLSYDNTTGIFTFNPTDVSSFLTSFTETDPIFVASPAYGITTTNISNWNNAHTWGDHSLEGYLKAADAPQSDWNATGTLAEILNKPTLFSGSYTDLTNKPTLFSGSYNDLTNKPTIPAAQVQSDWNEPDTAELSYIQNKPTIPTVPNNVSSFNNDAGYLTTYTDTNTTYSLDSSNENVDDVKIALIGSDSTTDSVVITKGTNITFSNVTTGGFTISASATGPDTNDYVDTASLTGTDLVLGRTGALADLTVDLSSLGGGGGSGTVTSIATGTGLSGGPITSTGTIALDATIGQLTNVNVTGANAPNDGQVLKWVQSASAWQPANDLTASGGGVNVLQDLNDVVYTGTSDGGGPLDVGDVLSWNGSNWTDVQLSISSFVVSDLSDVANATPNDGEALLWDATNNLWVPGAVSGGGGGSDTNDYVDSASLNGTDLVIGRTGALADLTVDLSTLSGGATALNALTDVNAGAPGDGQVLKWQVATGKWIAANDQTATGNSGISLNDLSTTTNPVGTSALSYNSSTGVFSYTPPDLSGYLTSTTSTAIVVGGNGSNGGITLADGNLAIRTGTGNVATIDLYCEIGNLHKVSIRAPLHTNYSGNVNFVLPPNEGSADQVLRTDGNGNTSWVAQTQAGTISNTSYTRPGGTSRSLQLRLEDYTSVKDFGAVGDGTTDDTNAISTALNNGGAVYFPKGDYKVTSTITLFEGIRIFGDGPGSRILYAPQVTGLDCFQFKYDSGGYGDEDYYVVSDIAILCEASFVAGAGIRLEYTGPAAVVGAFNRLILNNVEIGSKWSPGSFGYFITGLYILNASGVMASNLSIYTNAGDQTTEADTFAIDINNTINGHAMIRTFMATNIYLQFYRTGIRTRSTGGTIESLYVSQGECLAFRGFDINAGQAIDITSMHFDVQDQALNLNSNGGPTRIVGNDIRGQRTDKPITARELIYIKGDDVTMTGNFMASDRTTLAVIFIDHDAKAVSITGNVIKGISDRTFYALKVNDYATDVYFGGNSITEFSNNVDPFIDDSNQATIFGQRGGNTV